MVSSDGFEVCLVLLLLVVMVTGTLGCVAGRCGVQQCRWLCCCFAVDGAVSGGVGGSVAVTGGGDDIFIPSY